MNHLNAKLKKLEKELKINSKNTEEKIVKIEV